MVTDMILDVFFAALVEVVTMVLPGGEPLVPPVGFSFITDVNYFLPITEMFVLFATVFAFGGPLALASIAVWLVVGVLRGGSTKA